MPGGVHLARGMWNGKLPKMLLDTKPKQEKNPYGTSLVENDEYELQVLEWKENAKIKTERKKNVSRGNQKLYVILINQLLPTICSNIEGATGHNQVEANQDGIALLKLLKRSRA